MDRFFKRHIIYEKWYNNEYEQHVICYKAIQSSIKADFFSVEKKLQKQIQLSIRHNYFFKD